MPRSDIPVITPYNPLDKRNLAESVASAMLHTPVQKLPPEPFIGAGVYAIYYKGDFEPYRKLVELNQDGWNVPIYVGKAVPSGCKKRWFWGKCRPRSSSCKSSFRTFHFCFKSIQS